MRPPGRLAGPLLAAALAAAALPAAATAGTVSVKDGTVTFTAAPGEANDLRVSQTSEGFAFADFGAPITASAGCAPAGASKATCTVETGRVVARLGDGDDKGAATAGDFGVRIDGEGGADAIRSVTTNADLRGGPGDDDITCEGRSCAMLGGIGADWMRGYTEPEYPGGDGSVSYRDHTAGVRVTVDGIADDGNASDGPVGERDNVIAIRALVGGPGDDDLSDGPNDPRYPGNALYGMGGNDTLHGLGGGDLVMGGSGTDHLDGGPGSDSLYPDGTTREDPAAPPVRLDATPGPNDVVVGGPDEDQVVYSRTAFVAVSLDGVANDGASGEGDDVATDVEDITMGAAGPSVLVGNGLPNDITGGWGKDDISGGGGADHLTGFGGADRLSGGAGNDVLQGNAALAQDPGDADALDGGTGDDILSAGDGDDLLDGGPGADQLSGEGGSDTASYTTRTGRLVITLAGGGADDGVDADGDGAADEHDNLYTGIENVTGGSGADRVTGNAAANHLSGGGGPTASKASTATTSSTARAEPTRWKAAPARTASARASTPTAPTT
ncbi:MAG TPA: hypothetical protein VF533_12815 [Solirubrobacteraceae bacterium]